MPARYQQNLSISEEERDKWEYACQISGLNKKEVAIVGVEYIIQEDEKRKKNLVDIKE